jgi:exopolyphosphatase/guanosine-5'-triphosphate,3'-diphosphate pyrophosphatase
LPGELRSSDRVLVREQLGREPTTPFTVVARCTGGHPLVIRNSPLDADGRPFPTTFWLTCPDAVKAVSRLESAGWIRQLDADPAFAGAIARSHQEYAIERARDLPEARDWGGVGGTRTGLKCLHAHYAWHLAGGDDAVGVWVAGRIEPVHPEERRGRVAAIDQGTNSIRLLVAEPGGSGFTELARDMVITRLGQGVDASGTLREDALERTVAVLARFCRRARALGVGRIRVGATSAVRDASNADRFASAVRDHARTELEVMSGDHEARLSFLGGTQGLDPAEGPFCVIDIGGGSTELVVGREPGRAEQAVSTQVGSVRLTERFIRHDPPAPEELERITAEVERVLAREVEPGVPARDAHTFVAVGGTATTTQAVAMRLEVYDPDVVHRSRLALEAAAATLDRFASMTNAERSALPVMPPGRGEVITAGAAILVTSMRHLGFEEALVSETDILDGLVLEMLGIG